MKKCVDGVFIPISIPPTDQPTLRPPEPVAPSRQQAVPQPKVPTYDNEHPTPATCIDSQGIRRNFKDIVGDEICGWDGKMYKTPPR